jgi:Na+-transporting NADH:ubiquinone oxidoreductase subunit F
MLELLPSLLIISGLAAVLALLIEVAKRYLLDYGEVKIIMNQERELTVTGGAPLLFSLMDEGIYLPSACGGRGTCSLCKVKVMDGGGPLLPTETPYLSPEEIENQTRLSCQVKVREDISIQVPEELFLIKEFKVKVTDITPMSSNINLILFKIISPEEGMTFKPGQYVQLQMPREKAGDDPEYRAYSICSACAYPYDLELLITHVPEGVVSGYVHKELEIGDELTIVGPFGEFFYQDNESDMLLIATGSGLAPIRSILQHIEMEHIQRKATLFFGARTLDDLIYHDELLETAERMPNFTYYPVLSRPTEEDNWEGEKGRVTNLIQQHIPEGADIEVYICGNPAMVDSAEEELIKKGISEEKIYYDKFA